MSDDSHIWSEIYALDSKIKECNEAKTGIQYIKNNCSSKKDSWRTSFDKLAADSDLYEVKSTDLFEGNMANELGGRVTEAINQVNGGIAQSEALESALDSQIKKLNQTIERLYSERASLVRQLD